MAMRKRELTELTDDVVMVMEEEPKDVAELLEKLQVGEYWEKPFQIKGNPRDTTGLTRYLNLLARAGLDLCRGDSSFGYRMPLPESEAVNRYLHIFRRR